MADQQSATTMAEQLPASMADSTALQQRRIAALHDQAEMLAGQSTLADVTSVWISILMLWFPLEEEYQLRIKPTRTRIEIYVMRVAQRPSDDDVSFTPVFVIRCYGWSERFSYPDALLVAFEQLSSNVRRICSSVDAHGFPAYAAVACAATVSLCQIDPSAAVTPIYHYGSESSSAWVPNGGFEPYLDHVKADFVRAWNDIEMELQS